MCRIHVFLNLVSFSAVCPSNNIGIMFLNEVALGREHTITVDDCSLRKPPNGSDSVVARGRQEPGWIIFCFLKILCKNGNPLLW